MLLLTEYHLKKHLAIVKNLQLGDLDTHTQHAGQLQQAVRQFADQGLQQIHVFCRAFVDDDLAHLAVVQHAAYVVVVRQQRLRPKVQFGIHLDRLWRTLFQFQYAQAGVETQAGECQGVLALGGRHGVP